MHVGNIVNNIVMTMYQIGTTLTRGHVVHDINV